MDTEQNLFDREFRSIIESLGKDTYERYQKGLEVEGLKAALIDECEQGLNCDEAIARSNIRLLNELASDLGQFGHVTITGDVFVEEGEGLVHYELMQPVDATLREFDMQSSPDHTSHAFVYQFENIMIDGMPATGFGAVDMVKLLPVIEDTPA